MAELPFFKRRETALPYLLEEAIENKALHWLQGGETPENRSGEPLFLFWNTPGYTDNLPEGAFPDTSCGPVSGGCGLFPGKSG